MLRRESDAQRAVSYLNSGKFERDFSYAMGLFIEALSNGMRAFLTGLHDEVSKHFLLNNVALDAEPFWEEWPDTIDA